MFDGEILDEIYKDGRKAGIEKKIGVTKKERVKVGGKERGSLT